MPTAMCVTRVSGTAAPDRVKIKVCQPQAIVKVFNRKLSTVLNDKELFTRTKSYILQVFLFP
jgi:hypothetical protein